jgi:autotransporter translocation and assembly factor TamB
MLTKQESSAVSNNTAAIARNIGYNQLSSVLKESLQTSLDLDVVEISGSDTWNAAKLKVGKYVTKNLYLSYEQGFAFDKDSKVLDTETINLEYQILRFLFLRASNQESQSGFDLIFKYSWK